MRQAWTWRLKQSSGLSSTGIYSQRLNQRTAVKKIGQWEVSKAKWNHANESDVPGRYDHWLLFLWWEFIALPPCEGRWSDAETSLNWETLVKPVSVHSVG